MHMPQSVTVGVSCEIKQKVYLMCIFNMVLSTVRLEVHRAVKEKFFVFEIMITYNLLHGAQRFAGTNRNVHSVMS